MYLYDSIKYTVGSTRPDPKYAFKLLESLPSAAQKELVSQMKYFVYEKKQIIHREGFMPVGLFIIKKGKVKIFRVSDSSREIILHIAGEGDMIGYSALMRRSEYHFWSETIEKTELYFIPKKLFYEYIEQHPSFSVHLMHSFAIQFDSIMDKMADILSDHVRKRAAKTLIWLMETHGMAEEDKTIKITLSRNDLSHLVATNVETLVRTLADFRKERIIEFKRKKIQIIDMDKLDKVAHT